MSTPTYHDRMGTMPMYFVTAVSASLSFITLALMLIGSASTGATVIFGLFALFLSGTLLIMSRLFLDIDDKGIRYSFSRVLKRSINYADIERVEPQPYDWKEFVGWGIRWSMKGHLAYSLVGMHSALRIHLHDGSQFVVSCSRPKAASRAVEHYLQTSKTDAPQNSPEQLP